MVIRTVASTKWQSGMKVADGTGALADLIAGSGACTAWLLRFTGIPRETGPPPESAIQINPLVNQRRETASDDEVHPVKDAPASGGAAESPLAAANAGGERVPDSASGAIPEKGRVLLLDDDPEFREIIREFLAGHGYTVVAVQNGGEGVREVLGGDFALVLCDFIMPGLTGDMFYRAVERIRPALCQRFVFMTGHSNDAATNAFITKADAVVLRKPFPLTKLLASIAFTETRIAFHSVSDHRATGPELSRVSEPVDFFHALGPAAAHSSAVAKILARARNDRPPAGPSEAPIGSEPEPRAGGRSGAYAAAVAVLLSVAVGLWFAYWNARDRSEAAAAKRVAIESEWAALSPGLQEALATRSKAAAAANQLARLSAERAKPRWTPALRSIVPPGDAKIDILEVSARGEMKDLGKCEVRVRGMAGGAVPAQMAGRFLQSAEDNLKGNANGRPVSVAFEPHAKTPGALPDDKRADFVMIVTTGSPEPAVAMGKEGR